MTDKQAKAIATRSVRKGRKRARDLIIKIVSYFMDSYVSKGVVLTRQGMDADIRQALLNPAHPARTYEDVDKFIEKTLSESLLDPTLRGRFFTINF